MKKGFTLIELLAVIVILAVILVIAISQVLKVVDNSRISAYLKNEQMVLKAIDLYVSRNTGSLPGEIGSTTEVSINYLVSNGMLTEIKNPYNKTEDCTGYVTIMKLSDTEYDYTPHLKCGLYIHDSSDDGLVGHWKLDGNALDYSANNNHGNIYNVTLSTDRFNRENKSMSFNGVDSFIDLNSALIPNSNFTFMSWINFPQIEKTSIDNTNSHVIVSQFGDSFTLYACTTFGTADMQMRLIVSTPEVIVGPDLRGEGWRHIVLTRSGNMWTLYVDGKEYISKLDQRNVSQTGNTLIGRSTNSGRHYNGLIDDVRIYNRALLDREIKLLYESTK